MTSLVRLLAVGLMAAVFLRCDGAKMVTKDKPDFHWGLDLSRFSESDRKLVLAAVRAGETSLADQGFQSDLLTHAKVEKPYVYLYISPIVVRPNESYKSAAEFMVEQDGRTAKVAGWTDGRSNLPPEETPTGRDYDKGGFFRRSPEADSLIQWMDALLKASGELEALGRLPGGMQQLVQKWQVFILEASPEVPWHTLLAEPYDNPYLNVAIQVGPEAKEISYVDVTRMEPETL